MGGNGLLHDKVALVTGGGGDIGRAISLALASEGARVAVCGRSQNSLSETADAIHTIGGQVVTMIADVSALEDVQRMIGTVLSEWAQLDILVNNAGIISSCPVVDLPEKEWLHTIDVNLTGTFLCAKYAAREMLRSERGGRIINISSRAGKVGMKNVAHYSASKFGVIGLTQSLALELAPHGITVNAICPGRIEGKMGRADVLATAKSLGISEMQAEKDYSSPVPIGRLGLADEVAAAVVFLCSEKAGYITGESINVTGGLDLVRGGQ